MRKYSFMSKSRRFISASRKVISAGFSASVVSIMSSTGSICPIPKHCFQSRLAIVSANRGLSLDVAQRAKACRGVSPGLMSAGLPNRAFGSTTSPGLAFVYW